MSKESIVSQITQAYEKLGVAFTRGKAADVEIHTEFLNAGWSIGKKKFVYDAFLTADEAEKTVFLWQKSTESGGGLQLGGGYEMDTQVGATVFKKVKIVQYGPEGKVAEMVVDLGQIAKIAKDAAKQNGWKFKTVLRQEKAKYSV